MLPHAAIGGLKLDPDEREPIRVNVNQYRIEQWNDDHTR